MRVRPSTILFCILLFALAFILVHAAFSQTNDPVPIPVQPASSGWLAWLIKYLPIIIPDLILFLGGVQRWAEARAAGNKVLPKLLFGRNVPKATTPVLNPGWDKSKYP